MAATSAEVAAGVDRWWLQWIRSCSTWSLSVSRAHVVLKRAQKQWFLPQSGFICWQNDDDHHHLLFSVADFLTKPHGSTWPIHFDTGLCPHWFAALLRLDRSSRSSPLRQSLSASLTQAAGLRRAPGIEVNTSLGSSLGAVGICG